MSYQNLHEVGSSIDHQRTQQITLPSNNFSTTQKSIKIYRNAIKNSHNGSASGSQQRQNESQTMIKRELSSSNNQQAHYAPDLMMITSKFSVNHSMAGSKSQRANIGLPNQINTVNHQNLINPTQLQNAINIVQMKHQFKNPGSNLAQNTSNNGFIDRTIRTSTSQFISPKTNLQQISKGMSSGTNTQNIQFFNQPVERVRKNGPFGPIVAPSQSIAQTNNNQFENLQMSKFVQNFSIRKIFKIWKVKTTKQSYERKRLTLLDQFSFYTFSIKNLKQGDKLTREHIRFLRDLEVCKSTIAFDRVSLQNSIPLSDFKASLHQLMVYEERIGLVVQKQISSLFSYLKNCLLDPIAEINKVRFSIQFDKSDLQISIQTLLEQIVNLMEQKLDEINQITNLIKVLANIQIDQAVLVTLKERIQGDQMIIKEICEKFDNQISEIRDFFLSNQHETLSDPDLWGLLSQFTDTLNSIQVEYSFNYIVLSMEPVLTLFKQMIQQMQRQVEARVIGQLERDTDRLRGDLGQSIEIIGDTNRSDSVSLGSGGSGGVQVQSYIEQMNTIKVLSPTMLENLNSRLQQIKHLSTLLPKDAQNSQRILQNIRHLSNQVSILPELIKSCNDRLAKQKPIVHQLMIHACLQMSKKIAQLSEKYKDRYVERTDFHTLDIQQATQILEEVRMRGKMIEEVTHKVQTYKDCMDAIGLQIDGKLTCFQDAANLQEMHTVNLQLWEVFTEYMQQKDTLYKQIPPPSYQEVIKCMEKVQSRLPQSTANMALEVFLRDQSSFKVLEDLEPYKKLLNGGLKDTEWRLLGDLTGIKDLCLRELIQRQVDIEDVVIEELVSMAERDRVEYCIIKRCIDLLNRDYKDISDSTREDAMIEVHKMAKKGKEEAQEVLEKMRKAEEIVSKVREIEKSVKSIRAVMEYKAIHEHTLEVRPQYEQLLSLFSEMENTLSQNPLLEGIYQQEGYLQTLIQQIQPIEDILHQAIDDFFEQKRIQFPRLFFMTDKDCLDFIAQSLSKERNIDPYIPLIFPGAQKLLIDAAICPQGGTFDPSNLDITIMSELKKVTNTYTDERKGLIRGMISRHQELLTFHEPIPFNTDELAQTLQAVEQGMQSTIGNLISQAVGSFPKQSLDEWIMDYPLQTILTTIHLILTHEINELFDDLARGDNHHNNDDQNMHFTNEEDFDEYGKVLNQQLPQQIGEQDHFDRVRMGIEHLASLHKTPDTRDLVVATTSSYAHQKPIVGMHPQGHHQRTISLQNMDQEFFKSKSIKGVFGRSLAQNVAINRPYHQRIKSCQQPLVFRQFDLQHSSEEQYSPVKVQIEESEDFQQNNQILELKNFHADMFGEDFELMFNEQTLEKLVGKDRDVTMKVLQEKSFKGLYLRLQFWINQICKSLKLTQSQDRDMMTGFKHSPLQQMSMMTIINFLTYMRDVVYELKQKQVQSIEDFDWQKQMRLTWQGNQNDETRGCKVECGAWQSYQANEYIGNFVNRLPLTPHTNKYYVFIAAALREKSAVLFKCMPTHDYSIDLFQEFSNLCTVPLRAFQCANPYITMKSLMQFLNGAALASTWIFFEHVDKLDYLHLQTFNKEIQMVQQQFIIAELSQDSENEEHKEDDQQLPMPEGLSQRDNSQNFQSPLPSGGPGTQRPQIKNSPKVNISSNNQMKVVRDTNHNQINNYSQNEEYYYEELPPPQQENTQSKNYPSRSSNKLDNNALHANRVCFGVFASISHPFTLLRESWAVELSHSLQSAFRVLSLTRPELPLLTSMYLKSHSFIQHQSLSDGIHQAIFYVQDAVQSILGDRTDAFTVTVRDIRRLACAAASYKNLNYFCSENEAVAEVMKLWILEKIQHLELQINLDEVIEKTLSWRPQFMFNKVAQSKSHSLKDANNEQINQAQETMRQGRPIIIIGQDREKFVKILTQDYLKLKPVYFDPEVMGTFREVYGAVDPISPAQQAMNDQLGLIETSIIQNVISDLTPENCLILTSSLHSPIYDTFLPYFTFLTHQEHPDTEPSTSPMPTVFPLTLPNSLQISFPTKLPIIILQETLTHASPRLISSISLIMLKQDIERNQSPSLQKCFEIASIDSLRIHNMHSKEEKSIIKQIWMAVNSDKKRQIEKICPYIIEQPVGEFSLTIDGKYVLTSYISKLINYIEDNSENIVIVGDKGVGKSTLLQYMVSKDKERSLLLRQSKLMRFKELRNRIIEIKQNDKLHVYLDDISLTDCQPHTTNLAAFLNILRNNSFNLYQPNNKLYKLPLKSMRLIATSSIYLKDFTPVYLSYENDSKFVEALIKVKLGEVRAELKSKLLSITKNQSNIKGIVKVIEQETGRKLSFDSFVKSMIIQNCDDCQECEIIELNVKNYKDYSELIDQLAGLIKIKYQNINLRIPECLNKDRLNFEILEAFFEGLNSQNSLVFESWNILLQNKLSLQSKPLTIQLVHNKNQESSNQISSLIHQVSDWCKQLVSKYPNIPNSYIQSNERPVFLEQIYSKIYHKSQEYLQEKISRYQRLKIHYEKLLEAIREGENKNLGKVQNNVIDMMNVKERLDLITHRLKFIEGQSKSNERQLNHLRNQMSQIQSSKQSNSKASVMTSLRMFNESHFQHIKLQMRNEDASQLMFALSLFCQHKKIFELPYEEILNRIDIGLTRANTLQVQELIVSIQKLQQKQFKPSSDSFLAYVYQALTLIVFNAQNHNNDQTKLQMISLKDKITYHEQYSQLLKCQITKANEEAEELLIKENNLKREVSQVDVRIDLSSKNARNEMILRGIIKEGKRFEQKIDQLRIQQKNCEGDSILIASSIAYLGIVPIEERIKIRAELAEKLMLQSNLESNECWSDKTSEQINCKVFKITLKKVLGIDTNKFIKKIPFSIIDSVFQEYMVSVILSPKAVISIDQTGIYPSFLNENVLKNNAKQVIASDHHASQIGSMYESQNNTKILILKDYHDFSHQNAGRTSDLGSSVIQLLDLKTNQLSKEVSYSMPKLIIQNPSLNISDEQLLSNCVVYDSTFINKTESWIELKLILLKNFLPDNYQKLTVVINQTKSLKAKLHSLKEKFQRSFLYLDPQSVQIRDPKSLEGNSKMRQIYLEYKQAQDDYNQFNIMFHQMINEHPLLASYSNIFVILYHSLKELSAHTGETTYSWRIYTKMLNLIVSKVIRDLTLNMKQQQNDSQNEDNGDKLNSTEKQLKDQGKKKDKEFTIDEDFFHSVIMPGIYSTIMAGLRQEHISLFNLIFSMEIAMKKGSITVEEKEFFINRFFMIKNCYDWRLNIHKPSTVPSGFISPLQEDCKQQVQTYQDLKRDLMKLYPDTRKFFEIFELRVGKDYSFRNASQLIYKKLFKRQSSNDDYYLQSLQNTPLMKQLNLGFLCPDNEWRSKICQFVYEELTTIFDFTEELNKLHNFIKTASWNLTVALFTQNPINIVNTVCSIASYYGVGLEVLRTDSQQSMRKKQNYYLDQEYTDPCYEYNPDFPLSDEGAVLHHERISHPITDCKANYQRMYRKDEMEVDDKQPTNQSTPAQQIDLIKKCAENGTWVLISTLRFPSYWDKICRKLEKMATKGKIMNTFRIFFDLQGYSMQEIPESFLFDSAVKFYLTEKNNEDMEGFNDVWANILNDDLLNAKELNQVYQLEPKTSDSFNFKLQTGDNQHATLDPNLIPHTRSINPHNEEGGPLSGRQSSMSSNINLSHHQQSIVLPLHFTRDYLDEIVIGGKDLEEPRGKRSRLIGGTNAKRRFKEHLFIESDKVSEISHQHGYNENQMISSRQLNSLAESFLFEVDNPNEIIRSDTPVILKPQRGQQIEMIATKQPGKRLQPAQKH